MKTPPTTHVCFEWLNNIISPLSIYQFFLNDDGLGEIDAVVAFHGIGISAGGQHIDTIAEGNARRQHSLVFNHIGAVTGGAAENKGSQGLAVAFADDWIVETIKIQHFDQSLESAYIQIQPLAFTTSCPVNDGRSHNSGVADQSAARFDQQFGFISICYKNTRIMAEKINSQL